MSRQVKDHKGKQYNSIAEMCRDYDIPYSTYLARIRAGWSVEKALTYPLHTRVSPLGGEIRWIDHKGNKFPTAKEMCKHWNVSFSLFTKRRERGWNIKDALTRPLHYKLNPSAGKACVDHKGNIYNSEQEMCKRYRISLTLFCKRRSRGYGLEKALTMPVRARKGK